MPVEEDMISKMFLDGLGTSISNGISSNNNELKDRERIYGHNRKE